VLSGLRAESRSPALLTEYVKAYHEDRSRLAAGSIQRRARAEQRLDEIKGETKRLVDAIAKETPRSGLTYQRIEVRAGTAARRAFVLAGRREGSICESAWNKDPVFGVIGIQSGPRG
jgi:hypothetical protein